MKKTIKLGVFASLLSIFMFGGFTAQAAAAVSGSNCKAYQYTLNGTPLYKVRARFVNNENVSHTVGVRVVGASAVYGSVLTLGSTTTLSSTLVSNAGSAQRYVDIYGWGTASSVSGMPSC